MPIADVNAIVQRPAYVVQKTCLEEAAKVGTNRSYLLYSSPIGYMGERWHSFSQRFIVFVCSCPSEM